MTENMPAGRELDALVAKKVMGWTPMLGRPHFFFAAVEILKAQYESIEHYSTDIAAAWEVVEKIKDMKPNGKSFGLKPGYPCEFVISWNEQGKWTAGWQPYNLDGVATLEAEADTAAHAICLAALRSVGE